MDGDTMRGKRNSQEKPILFTLTYQVKTAQTPQAQAGGSGAEAPSIAYNKSWSHEGKGKWFHLGFENSFISLWKESQFKRDSAITD